MTYEGQKQIVRTHICLDCGSGLVLVHDPATGGPTIRCGQDKSHLEYRLPQGPEEKIRRGEYPQGATERDKQALEAAVGRNLVQEDLYLSKDLESGEAVLASLRVLALALADKVGLHADLGHICIYRGKPRITIDGYYYHAARQHVPVRVGTRPLTLLERQDYQIEEGNHAWIARGFIRGEDQQITGLGIVTAAEITERSRKHPDQLRSPVVAKNPQRMAEKRAEWQCLRKLVPLGIEEESDADS